MTIVRRTLAVLFAITATVSPVRADDVDEFVKAMMSQRRIPAISIAVVRDGAVIKAASYGVADLEHQVAARPETVFKIASVGKQFIAAGVMLLVQDGKLSVDDHVRQHIPEAPAAWTDITLRHLLTHTSGLVRESPAFAPDIQRPDIELIAAAFAVPLQSNPGAKFSYSNLGYYVLAEVVARKSGTSWPQFLADRIFRPLGMTSTRPTSRTDLVPHRARGYVRTDEGYVNADDWTALRPSGGFLSTALDMAKWEIALQSGVILTAASKGEMWKPVTLSDGTRYPYGFGWELDDFPPGGFMTGVTMIRHEGTDPGFRPAFVRLPGQRLGVIVLTNLYRAMVDSIVAGIAVRYAPELKPAALRRWDGPALGLQD